MNIVYEGDLNSKIGTEFYFSPTLDMVAVFTGNRLIHISPLDLSEKFFQVKFREEVYTFGWGCHGKTFVICRPHELQNKKTVWLITIHDIDLNGKIIHNFHIDAEVMVINWFHSPDLKYYFNHKDIKIDLPPVRKLFPYALRKREVYEHTPLLIRKLNGIHVMAIAGIASLRLYYFGVFQFLTLRLKRYIKNVDNVTIHRNLISSNFNCMSMLIGQGKKLKMVVLNSQKLGSVMSELYCVAQQFSHISRLLKSISRTVSHIKNTYTILYEGLVKNVLLRRYRRCFFFKYDKKWRYHQAIKKIKEKDDSHIEFLKKEASRIRFVKYRNTRQENLEIKQSLPIQHLTKQQLLEELESEGEEEEEEEEEEIEKLSSPKTKEEVLNIEDLNISEIKEEDRMEVDEEEILIKTDSSSESDDDDNNNKKNKNEENELRGERVEIGDGTFYRREIPPSFENWVDLIALDEYDQMSEEGRNVYEEQKKRENHDGEIFDTNSNEFDYFDSVLLFQTPEFLNIKDLDDHTPDTASKLARKAKPKNEGFRISLKSCDEEIRNFEDTCEHLKNTFTRYILHGDMTVRLVDFFLKYMNDEYICRILRKFKCLRKAILTYVFDYLTPYIEHCIYRLSYIKSCSMFKDKFGYLGLEEKNFKKLIDLFHQLFVESRKIVKKVNEFSIYFTSFMQFLRYLFYFEVIEKDPDSTRKEIPLNTLIDDIEVRSFFTTLPSFRNIGTDKFQNLVKLIEEQFITSFSKLSKHLSSGIKKHGILLITDDLEKFRRKNTTIKRTYIEYPVKVHFQNLRYFQYFGFSYLNGKKLCILRWDTRKKKKFRRQIIVINCMKGYEIGAFTFLYIHPSVNPSSSSSSNECLDRLVCLFHPIESSSTAKAEKDKNIVGEFDEFSDELFEKKNRVGIIRLKEFKFRSMIPKASIDDVVKKKGNHQQKLTFKKIEYFEDVLGVYDCLEIKDNGDRVKEKFGSNLVDEHIPNSDQFQFTSKFDSCCGCLYSIQTNLIQTFKISVDENNKIKMKMNENSSIHEMKDE